jgi:hypothetical protein
MCGDGSCECVVDADATGNVVEKPSIDWDVDVDVDVRAESAFSRLASGRLKLCYCRARRRQLAGKVRPEIEHKVSKPFGSRSGSRVMIQSRQR